MHWRPSNTSPKPMPIHRANAMNEFEELCDKIEVAAREAVAAAGRGNWRRAAVELDAAAYLARDAEKIAARQAQTAVGVTELPDRTVAQSEPQVKDVLEA